MHPLRQANWGDIWKNTVEKRQTNATNVIMHPLSQAIWRDIWKYTVEKINDELMMMMIMGMMMTRIFRRKIVCWSFTWFIHLAYDDPVIWWFSCTKSWIDSPIAKRSSRPSNLIGIKITFWEKMVCFTKLTPRTPPSVIHGWKATDLLSQMVKRKNYLLNPISRQNFADALAENHNLKLEVCLTC